MVVVVVVMMKWSSWRRTYCPMMMRRTVVDDGYTAMMMMMRTMTPFPHFMFRFPLITPIKFAINNNWTADQVREREN